jgi:hypothetical protein
MAIALAFLGETEQHFKPRKKEQIVVTAKLTPRIPSKSKNPYILFKNNCLVPAK